MKSSSSAGDPLAEGATQGLSVLGDYELRRELGRGGMGTVYEAWQVSLQRLVALKVLSSHVAATPKAVARFRREAQAAAKLHHTHIVPIFAQGEANGTYFYAMEYVEGESLHAKIADLRNRYRPDSLAGDQAETVAIERADDSGSCRTQTAAVTMRADESAVRSSAADTTVAAGATAFGTPELFNDIARHSADVADALDYAHAQGVVHRDIKPHNLLFGRDGRLRISDFGLARLAEQTGVTVTGEMIGSPLYMSPEQITGDPNLVDQRTDIYSLGATMYEWLTLSPPYPGETRERVISRILSSEPRCLRAENPLVPVDLETICLKAIERDRSRRYQTAGELCDDLRRFVLSRPIVAKRAGPITRLTRFMSRHQLATLGTTAVLVACALLWALYVKEKTVRVQKDAAVKAEAAVVQATQQIEEAQEKQDLLVDALRMMASVVPGGGAVVESVARGDVPRPDMPVDALSMRKFTPTIGMPAGIAGRAVEDFYRSAVSPDWPGSADAGMNPLALNINGAFERWAAGDVESALGLVNDYLNALPSDMEAVQMHAALSALLGRFDVMRDDAERLLRDGGANGYLWRGLAFLLQNRVDQSLADLTRASALDQKSAWAKVFRGLALLQADRNADAVKVFDEVLRTSPTLAAAHLGRARAFTADGDYAAAVPDVEEVLKIDPKNAHALTIRGECRTSMGDYEAARKDFEDAMDVVGRVPELLIRWSAIVLQQRGGREKAETGAATEVKSRRGTVDPDEDSSRPPLFDWLSPKRKLPQSNRDGLDQSTGASDSLRMRWPFRLPT
jgi:serine/threonine protein kinase/tetratricopeptide (TPR) repeat protein